MSMSIDAMSTTAVSIDEMSIALASTTYAVSNDALSIQFDMMSIDVADHGSTSRVKAADRRPNEGKSLPELKGEFENQ
ncbi:MAG: hypothetical protein ACREBR_02390 [bacterium]